MPIDWRPFVELVKQHESFVLTSHMRPDCDAIGSELALAYALRSLGKTRAASSMATPCRHISRSSILSMKSGCSTATFAPPSSSRDVIVVVDTSAWNQLGPMADVVRKSSALKVVIDHHIGDDAIGAEVYQGRSCRGRRSTCTRGDRRAARARFGGNGDDAVLGHRHRHRLVSVFVGHRRDVTPPPDDWSIPGEARPRSSPHSTKTTALPGSGCRAAFCQREIRMRRPTDLQHGHARRPGRNRRGAPPTRKMW